MKLFNILTPKNNFVLTQNGELKIYGMHRNSTTTIYLELYDEILFTVDSDDLTYYIENNHKSMFNELAYKDEDGCYSIDERHYEDLNEKDQKYNKIVVKLYWEQLEDFYTNFNEQ